MAGSNFLELYSNTFFTLRTIRVSVNCCYTQGQIWDLIRRLPSVLNLWSRGSGGRSPSEAIGYLILFSTKIPCNPLLTLCMNILIFAEIRVAVTLCISLCMNIYKYLKLLLTFIMHSVTSFLDFQILKLIHFQKNSKGASQSQGGANAPPPTPLKETLVYVYMHVIFANI